MQFVKNFIGEKISRSFLTKTMIDLQSHYKMPRPCINIVANDRLGEVVFSPIRGL